MTNSCATCGTAALDGAYYCPARPAQPGEPEHPDRKPAPGLLLRAAQELGLALAASWIIGDSPRDLEAGRRAGCRGGALVRTGHDLGAAVVQEQEVIVDDLLAAAFWILQQSPLAGESFEECGKISHNPFVTWAAARTIILVRCLSPRYLLS